MARAKIPNYMEDQLLQLILELNRGPFEVTNSRFKEWALNKVSDILNFDSAVWVSGHFSENRFYLQSSQFFRNSHDGNIEPQNIDTTPLFYVELLEKPGTTQHLNFDLVPDISFLPQISPGISACRGIFTFSHNDKTKLFTFISLLRGPDSPEFTLQDCEFKKKLMSHLVQAHDHYRLQNLILQSHHDQVTRYRTAEVNFSGALQIAEFNFESVLNMEWPDWSGPTLPQEILPFLSNQIDGEFIGRKISIKFTSLEQCFLIRVRQRAGLELLTDKERLVAKNYMEGKSYKEVAKQLNIAPSTVRNHLSNIFLKLEVKNKAELVTKVRREE